MLELAMEMFKGVAVGMFGGCIIVSPVVALILWLAGRDEK